MRALGVLFLLISGPLWASEFAWNFQYSQTPDAWLTVNRLVDTKNFQFSTVESLLSSGGRYEEATARARFSLSKIELGSFPLARRMSIDLGAEAVGFLVLQNPVLPELDTHVAILGLLGIRFEGLIEKPRVATLIGIHGGFGPERRVVATITDFLGSSPAEKGTVEYIGFDFGFSRSHLLFGKIVFDPRFRFSYTLYKTNLRIAIQNQKLARSHDWLFRWRVELPFEQLDFPYGGATLTYHLIFGPSPQPHSLISPAWDYTHALDSVPEFGTLFGGGLRAKLPLGEALGFELTAGNYASYWGGHLKLGFGSAPYPLYFEFGTYGLEALSVSSGIEGRHWFVALGGGYPL